MKLFKLQDRYQAFRRRSSKRPGEPHGVLLVSSGGLGDTVLFALVLPRFLALANDGEAVTVLLRKGSDKMAFLFPGRVSVETVDFGRLRKDLSYRCGVCERLFAANTRLVVHTDYLRHPHLDEALVAACEAPETLAMEPRPWAKYDADLKANRSLYDRLFDSGGKHLNKVLRWHRFADWLSGTKAPLPEPCIAENRLPPAANEPGPLVLIQPFSAVKEKQSPVELYRRIVEQLPGDCRIVITGGPSDLERNPEFQELLAMANVEFDGSNFHDLVARLRAADLVISVDTACMHLAGVVGAPTLCLASAAYVGEMVPYDASLTPPKVRFLYQTMPCEGCLGACSLPAENGMWPCVARLDHDAVITAATEMAKTCSSAG
ncbi:MAG: glycosyltransferase family 9 protein [Candidatus Glassbacteria bacterium]|nr:glycosyltransferase family 9 protein [Candidatus Glassbacteria bacterium]